jgi:hypothetical protein
MKEYRLVNNSSEDSFEKEVNKLANEGWEVADFHVSIRNVYENSTQYFSALMERKLK